MNNFECSAFVSTRQAVKKKIIYRTKKLGEYYQTGFCSSDLKSCCLKVLFRISVWVWEREKLIVLTCQPKHRQRKKEEDTKVKEIHRNTDRERKI